VSQVKSWSILQYCDREIIANLKSENQEIIIMIGRQIIELALSQTFLAESDNRPESENNFSIGSRAQSEEPEGSFSTESICASFSVVNREIIYCNYAGRPFSFKDSPAWLERLFASVHLWQSRTVILEIVWTCENP
jgi:hypothetical protein